jgi:hypothetical protein
MNLTLPSIITNGVLEEDFHLICTMMGSLIMHQSYQFIYYIQFLVRTGIGLGDFFKF